MEKNTPKLRDKRNKGWFYLDNEYLNGLGGNLGPIGIAVYVSLCRHANDEQKCFPSQQLIAREIGASERSVRDYLKRLEEYNVILLGKERSNDGKWLNNVYYLTDKTEWKYPKATVADGQPQANNDTAIGNTRPSHRQEVPTNNTNKNNTNKKKTHIEFVLEEYFERFWKSYPRKVAKPTARNSFLKIKPDEELMKKIMNKLSAYKETEQWQKDKGRFIPHPATWLNQGRWEDVIEDDEEIIIPDYAKNWQPRK